MLALCTNPGLGLLCTEGMADLRHALHEIPVSVWPCVLALLHGAGLWI